MGRSCPYHGGGINYIMADGHYAWLPEGLTDGDQYKPDYLNLWKVLKDKDIKYQERGSG